MKKTVWILFILILNFTLWSNEVEDLEIKFEKNQYTINASFSSRLPKNQLLHVFFDYNHIVNCYDIFETITKDMIDDNTCIVNFHYKKGNLTMDSIYERIINTQLLDVNFKLIDQTRSTKLLPKVKASMGHFKIIPMKEKNLIVYYQTTEMQSSLNTVQKLFIKSNTNRFVIHITEYLEQLEQKANKNE